MVKNEGLEALPLVLFKIQKGRTNLLKELTNNRLKAVKPLLSFLFFQDVSPETDRV
jgi:hypothetical protein